MKSKVPAIVEHERQKGEIFSDIEIITNPAPALGLGVLEKTSPTRFLSFYLSMIENVREGRWNSWCV